MQFFPKFAAFNISWHEQPKKQIYSFVEPKGYLTRPEMSNFEGNHAKEYQQFLYELKR